MICGLARGSVRKFNRLYLGNEESVRKTRYDILKYDEASSVNNESVHLSRPASANLISPLLESEAKEEIDE